MIPFLLSLRAVTSNIGARLKSRTQGKFEQISLKKNSRMSVDGKKETEK
jgi:hypothetical protein